MLWIPSILGTIGIIGLAIFVPIGIILLIVANSRDDQSSKEKIKKIAKWMIFLPIALVMISLLLSILTNLSTQLLNK